MNAARISAERKAGQLLKEIERSKGGQPKKNSSPDGDSSRETEYQRVKREADISEKQAERWQQLAALPHGGFEGRLHNPLVKPTTSGIEKSKGGRPQAGMPGRQIAPVTRPCQQAKREAAASPGEPVKDPKTMDGRGL